jgi:M6 family metalloprotease-like protein
MGLELQTNGEFVNINPTLKEAVDNYEILPPRLPEPQPEIIFLPTGAVTAQQSVQELKMLVVLVQFTDETAKTTKAEMEELFFGEDGFADFYEEQSYGALKITGDVVGWYDAPQTMGYYGDNYEYRVADLIEEAVDLANTDVDFSQYDGDGDGIVDSFFVVHAGEPDENGGGNGPEIWSHYYSISGKTVDGVKVVDYETVSEESPLGIIAHEFGHYLGLPDYYDTYYDDGTSKGAGDWSLMAYGAYVDEPVIDPWSKEYLGWLFSDNYLELSEDGYYDVAQDNAALGIKYYMIPLSSSESFYLENRHVHDLMKKNDAGGILIWHVDESIMEETGSWNGCTGTRWTCNTVNSNSEHLFVALEQADGEYDLESDDLGDVDDAWFSDCGFGSCSPAQFSSVSEPSSLGYYSSSYDVAVSVNSEIGSSMEIGVSFSGILLAPEEVEEVSTSGGVEVSDEEVESSSSSGSSSGMPSWVYVVIGVLIVVILGVVVFVGLGLLRKE